MKNNLRKILISLISLVFILSLASCSGGSKGLYKKAKENTSKRLKTDERSIIEANPVLKRADEIQKGSFENEVLSITNTGMPVKVHYKNDKTNKTSEIKAGMYSDPSAEAEALLELNVVSTDQEFSFQYGSIHYKVPFKDLEQNINSWIVPKSEDSEDSETPEEDAQIDEQPAIMKTAVDAIDMLKYSNLTNFNSIKRFLSIQEIENEITALEDIMEYEELKEEEEIEIEEGKVQAKVISLKMPKEQALNVWVDAFVKKINETDRFENLFFAASLLAPQIPVKTVMTEGLESIKGLKDEDFTLKVYVHNNIIVKTNLELTKPISVSGGLKVKAISANLSGDEFLLNKAGLDITFEAENSEEIDLSIDANANLKAVDGKLNYDMTVLNSEKLLKALSSTNPLEEESTTESLENESTTSEEVLTNEAGETVAGTTSEVTSEAETLTELESTQDAVATTVTSTDEESTTVGESTTTEASTSETTTSDDIAEENKEDKITFSYVWDVEKTDGHNTTIKLDTQGKTNEALFGTVAIVNDEVVYDFIESFGSKTVIREFKEELKMAEELPNLFDKTLEEVMQEVQMEVMKLLYGGQ